MFTIVLSNIFLSNIFLSNINDKGISRFLHETLKLNEITPLHIGLSHNLNFPDSEFTYFNINNHTNINVMLRSQKFVRNKDHTSYSPAIVNWISEMYRRNNFYKNFCHFINQVGYKPVQYKSFYMMICTEG